MRKAECLNRKVYALIKADLHIHTKASDGSETPESVIVQARDRGLDMIAVTDHDVTENVSAAKALGKAENIAVVSGIEFSTAHKTELHVLGYFVDITNPKLTAYTKKTKNAREKRIVDYVKRLKEVGIDLDMTNLKALAGGGALSRAHLADALKNAGYVQTIEQAFGQYLGRDADTYIEKEKINIKDCIELIAECGGLSVWAHPVYHMDDAFDDLLDEMLSYGLNGLEVYHPDHSDKVAKTLNKLAQKKAMLVTCGSDYHGRVKPEIAIGSETRRDEYLDYCLKLFYKKATEGQENE
ncbi:MAG: PHP domain-containing protein [Eubacteriales bacterium]